MIDPYTTPNPARAALVTIDVQNDFTLAGAPARIPGTLEAVPIMRRVAEAFRAAGRPIIHVVRFYLPDGANVDICRRKAVEDGLAIARPGTSGADLVADLKPPSAGGLDGGALISGAFQSLGPNEWVMYKPRWSAFYDTSLADKLGELGVDTLVIVGCNFPNCPRSTFYDASNRDFRLALVPGAMSGLYDKGLAELAGIGVSMLSSDRVAAWLAGK